MLSGNLTTIPKQVAASSKLGRSYIIIPGCLPNIAALLVVSRLFCSQERVRASLRKSFVSPSGFHHAAQLGSCSIHFFYHYRCLQFVVIRL